MADFPQSLVDAAIDAKAGLTDYMIPRAITVAVLRSLDHDGWELTRWIDDEDYQVRDLNDLADELEGRQ